MGATTSAKSWTVSVPDDVDRIVRSISGGSETLPQLVRQTQYAGTEVTRELLARILRGELDNPNQTPRSVTALIEKLGQHDLETFLKLRRVIWTDADDTVNIYCMYDTNTYPGLLDQDEMLRLEQLGLIRFSPVTYKSVFRRPNGRKITSFGNSTLWILSPNPREFSLGNWDLTDDGRFLINLYEKDEVELLDGHLECNIAAWQKQELRVEIQPLTIRDASN